MNDIPRGTSRAKLISSLLTPRLGHDGNGGHREKSGKAQPDVIFSLAMAESRLDDELSVAVIEFSDPPKWLRHLNQDPYGFPKKTALGTLWRAVDTCAVDELGRTEFIRAAIEGNLQYAETLAEFEDTDINSYDNQGRTALHWACVESHPEIVRLCLSIPEFEIGHKDKDGLTAFDISQRGENEIIPTLFYRSMFEMEENHPQTALLRVLTVTSVPGKDRAAFPGAAIFDPVQDCNRPLVKALIDRGVDLTAVNKDGNTALHIAAKVGNVEIATRLLKAGADVNAVGSGGATPLHYAAHTAGKRMVQALLGWEATPNAKDNEGNTALDLAKDRGMVQRELERKENDQQNLTALHRAAEDGDMEILKLLLDLRVGVDEKNPYGKTALILAAKIGHLAIGQVLLEREANIETKDNAGRPALHWAVVFGHQGFVQLLLDRGANLAASDNVGRTALHLAAGKGFLHMVQLLLDRNADITLKDIDGKTALHWASHNRHLDVARLLLHRGADRGAKDKTGRTALQLAKEDRIENDVVIPKRVAGMGGQTAPDPEVAQASLDHIGPRNVNGLTVLLQAVLDGDLDTVQLLLELGADKEARDDSQQTALQLAVWNEHIDIVKALLARGAQTEAKNPWSQTALHLAVEKGHTEIV